VLLFQKDAPVIDRDLTEQEIQLLHMLRQWDAKESYRLQIETVDGAWDITLRELDTVDASGNRVPIKRGARGTGSNFAQAWDNMVPTHFPGS
jgi:hypothetical protein